MKLFDKIGIYMQNHFIRDNNRYYIINYNYLNMMSIVAVLSDLDNTHVREMYKSRMRCDIFNIFNLIKGNCIYIK